MATDGDASWRLEARRRRSPACCRNAGRLWWQPVTGRRQCSLRCNMLWTNRLQSFKRGNYPQILLGRRDFTGREAGFYNGQSGSSAPPGRWPPSSRPSPPGEGERFGWWLARARAGSGWMIAGGLRSARKIQNPIVKIQGNFTFQVSIRELVEAGDFTGREAGFYNGQSGSSALPE